MVISRRAAATGYHGDMMSNAYQRSLKVLRTAFEKAKHERFTAEDHYRVLKETMGPERTWARYLAIKASSRMNMAWYVYAKACRW
ncbi:MAG: hypothetical protein WCA92_18705 [Terriglobales bacterium]